MKEVEIKFRVADIAALEEKLRAAGFKLKTARTHEFNILYDLADGGLRKRGSPFSQAVKASLISPAV